MAIGVRSRESEAAMSALMRARAYGQVQEAAVTSRTFAIRSSIRPSMRTLRTGYARTLVIEDAIMRMVAICEHFASARLINVTDSLVPSRPEFVAPLWARNRSTATR